MKFWRCAGALMCDEPIDGVTQDLAAVPNDPEGSMKFYGGRYFICETIMAGAAQRIATLFGGDYEGEKENDVVRPVV